MREKNERLQIAVIGLGYVGLPLAVAFAKKTKVIGYDSNKKKIQTYKNGMDPTAEVGDEAVKNTTVYFTANPADLCEANFLIVAVPTPVFQDKTPDLTPVLDACRTIGRNLKPGSTIVFESTVYPGVTQDLCVPAIEEESGFVCGRDFWVGYSPERINPGDKEHTLSTVVKIVSGMDAATCDYIADVYSMVVAGGIFRAKSIMVAEAAKLVENAQRDINIAFMNELAMVFDRLKVSTHDVLDAMNTKWNALGFEPGLVGGHCIGVDPYYFVYQAENLGYHSQIILAGRKINDSMGRFVADAAIKMLVLAGKRVREAKVYILGASFKENCPDMRNSKVADIIRRLHEYDMVCNLVDPVVDPDEAAETFGISLTPLEEVRGADCLIFAVAHTCFRTLSSEQIESMFGAFEAGEKVIVDVKGMFKRELVEPKGYLYWEL
ncbi:MAG: nucleotide sugar dehydrogenase [Candidatus Pelethousia sp.]|nr:nucleotide sugar dehydrogenase [Candidatus Pelethousia sp.]